VVSCLKDWEGGLVWLAWWGATAYRMFGLVTVVKGTWDVPPRA